MVEIRDGELVAFIKDYPSRECCLIAKGKDKDDAVFQLAVKYLAMQQFKKFENILTPLRDKMCKCDFRF